MRVIRIEHWDSLVPYAAKWNELAAAGETSTVFQTFEWHESWWRAFSGGHRLLVLLVFDSEASSEPARLCAIAPLMVSIEGRIRSKQVLRLIGSLNHASDYCDFIARSGDDRPLAVVMEWLNANRACWDRADFFNFPSHSRHRLLLEKGLAGKGLGVISERLCDASTRLLGNDLEDREAVNKKSFKRHFNFFTKNGKLCFEHCENREVILGHLDRFFQQHIDRRALTESPSLFVQEDAKTFYRNLVETLHPQGWLRFSIVTFDDEPIAFHFGFEYASRYVWYKPSFSVKYEKNLRARFCSSSFSNTRCGPGWPSLISPWGRTPSNTASQI